MGHVFDRSGNIVWDTNSLFSQPYLSIGDSGDSHVILKNNFNQLYSLEFNLDPNIKEEKEIRKMKTPEIINVEMKVENKVVEVTFADFTTEKAVCIEPDVFDMERAIATCVAKKAMGGSGAYNNAVRKGLKVWENELKKQEFDKVEKERIEKKRAKLKAYKQRRKERKAAAEKERQIEIQKEAYIRAMKELEK